MHRLHFELIDSANRLGPLYDTIQHVYRTLGVFRERRWQSPELRRQMQNKTNSSILPTRNDAILALFATPCMFLHYVQQVLELKPFNRPKSMRLTSIQRPQDFSPQLTSRLFDWTAETLPEVRRICHSAKNASPSRRMWISID